MSEAFSPGFKTVTKEEFEQFLKDYPEKLVHDVCRVCDPPMISFNDFTKAEKWPESVVAKYFDRYYPTDDITYMIQEPESDNCQHEYICIMTGIGEIELCKHCRQKNKGKSDE